MMEKGWPYNLKDMTTKERLERLDKALDWIIIMLAPLYRAEGGTMEINQKEWDNFLKERGLRYRSKQ